MKTRILIVDDEPDVVELVEFNLRKAGYDVLTADDGTTALQRVRQDRPALVILDVMLPELDGLEVCKLMRRDPATAALPILMLTARAAEVDRVVGLELGAQDYLTKPFSPRELVLRVKNLLQRKETPADTGAPLVFAELTVDVAHHRVTVKGKPVELTATEFKLLTLLAQRRGRVQSRDQLLRDVWNYDAAIDTRTVDTHMRRLRDKIGGAARFLDTVRGVGYRFLPE